MSITGGGFLGCDLLIAEGAAFDVVSTISRFHERKKAVLWSVGAGEPKGRAFDGLALDGCHNDLWL